MFAVLKKEIESDFKEVDLDWKNPIFTGKILNLMSKTKLSKSDEKFILSHLNRYEKACKKDFDLRFPRLYNNIMTYADKKGKNWINDFKDNLDLLNRVDAYSIQYEYGSKALSVYLKIPYEKQLEFTKKLNNINTANLPKKEIDRRTNKFIDSYFNNLFINKK